MDAKLIINFFCRSTGAVIALVHPWLKGKLELKESAECVGKEYGKGSKGMDGGVRTPWLVASSPLSICIFNGGISGLSEKTPTPI